MNCPKCGEYFGSEIDLTQHRMLEILADKLEQEQIDEGYSNVQADAANIIALTHVCIMAGEGITPEEAVRRYFYLIDLILAHDAPPDNEPKTDIPDVWRTALRDEDDLSTLN